MSTTHSADLPRLDPIRPEVEALIRRHAAGAVVAERPQRRVGFLSAVGGVAFAAACTVALVVFGVSTGTQLASPQRAVAAVAHSLEGDGVLHWVRSGDDLERPASDGQRGTQVVEEWVDLANGDSHTIETDHPAGQGQPSRSREVWLVGGEAWGVVGRNDDGSPVIQRAPVEPSGAVVGQLRDSLERAERGEAEIAEAGEDDGTPLVVVTDRHDGNELRTWITREDSPRVVRVSSTVSTRNSPDPVTVTMTTSTWAVLPRSEAALANVQIPTEATRRP